jgi:D-alanyl-D-alanine dipeptidase
MKGLVNLKKYGFKITNRTRKDWASSKDIFIRKSVAEALVKAKEFLPKRYNFLIFDGKRSIADQRKIIKICEEDFKNKNPDNWKKMLIDFTGGYEILKKKKFSPMSHLGGGAVDLTIVDGKGRELDLGGDTFDKREALNYYEKKKNLTLREKQIRNNRRILKKAMIKAGFKSYPKEWIHWGLKK